MAFVVVVRVRPRSNIVHIPAATEKQSWWIFFSITFIASLNESARIQIRTAFVPVWTVTHCLGLGHETLVCAVCLSIFSWSVYIYLLGIDNALTPGTAVGYRNWPRYGLRWSDWYCNPAQHELCRPSRGRLRPRRPTQRVLCRIAVPTTTAQTV